MSGINIPPVKQLILTPSEDNSMWELCEKQDDSLIFFPRPLFIGQAPIGRVGTRVDYVSFISAVVNGIPKELCLYKRSKEDSIDIPSGFYPVYEVNSAPDSICYNSLNTERKIFHQQVLESIKLSKMQFINIMFLLYPVEVSFDSSNSYPNSTNATQQDYVHQLDKTEAEELNTEINQKNTFNQTYCKNENDPTQALIDSKSEIDGALAFFSNPEAFLEELNSIYIAHDNIELQEVMYAYLEEKISSYVYLECLTYFYVNPVTLAPNFLSIMFRKFLNEKHAPDIQERIDTLNDSVLWKNMQKNLRGISDKKIIAEINILCSAQINKFEQPHVTQHARDEEAQTKPAYKKELRIPLKLHKTLFKNKKAHASKKNDEETFLPDVNDLKRTLITLRIALTDLSTTEKITSVISVLEAQKLPYIFDTLNAKNENLLMIALQNQVACSSDQLIQLLVSRTNVIPFKNLNNHDVNNSILHLWALHATDVKHFSTLFQFFHKAILKKIETGMINFAGLTELLQNQDKKTFFDILLEKPSNVILVPHVLAHLRSLTKECKYVEALSHAWLINKLANKGNLYCQVERILITNKLTENAPAKACLETLSKEYIKLIKSIPDGQEHLLHMPSSPPKEAPYPEYRHDFFDYLRPHSLLIQEIHFFLRSINSEPNNEANIIAHTKTRINLICTTRKALISSCNSSSILSGDPICALIIGSMAFDYPDELRDPTVLYSTLQKLDLFSDQVIANLMEETLFFFEKGAFSGQAITDEYLKMLQVNVYAIMKDFVKFLDPTTRASWIRGAVNRCITELVKSEFYCLTTYNSIVEHNNKLTIMRQAKPNYQMLNAFRNFFEAEVTIRKNKQQNYWLNNYFARLFHIIQTLCAISDYRDSLTAVDSLGNNLAHELCLELNEILDELTKLLDQDLPASHKPKLEFYYGYLLEHINRVFFTVRLVNAMHENISYQTLLDFLNQPNADKKLPVELINDKHRHQYGLINETAMLDKQRRNDFFALPKEDDKVVRKNIFDLYNDFIEELAQNCAKQNKRTPPLKFVNLN